MSRLALVCGCVLATVAFGCSGEPLPKAGHPDGLPASASGVRSSTPDVPTRTLSRDDCSLLRDRQIEIVVDETVPRTEPTTRETRLSVEAEIRERFKSRFDEFIKGCVGKTVENAVFRCMRESTTTEGFKRCGKSTDIPDSRSSPAGK